MNRSILIVNVVYICLIVFIAGTVADSQAVKQAQYPLGKLLIKTVSNSVPVILKTWKLKGVRVCGLPPKVKICAFIENAYPSGIIEVVRRPFNTAMPELEFIYKPLRQVADRFMTSSHTNSSDDTESTLQFQDVHVYKFSPPFIDVGLIARPHAPGFGFSYSSELDGFSWRTGFVDMILHPGKVMYNCELNPGNYNNCAGRWGNLYPRSGFMIQDSEVVSAYLSAVRATQAANEKNHFVVSRYPWPARTGHYIQMIYPKDTNAIKIGSDELFDLEGGAVSIDGTYLFIHYGIFEYCKGCIKPRLVSARSPS